MVQQVIAFDYLESYIQNFTKLETCTVGLMLGQRSSTRDYVLHFAKTPPYQGIGANKRASKPPIKTINDVQDSWLADHANQATRLLPGGMYVLGIFIVSQDDVLSPLQPKIKSILSHIYKQLNNEKYMHGNPVDTTEKLVLNYSVQTATYTCRSYDTVNTAVKPVPFKFNSIENKWHEIECFYELDQVIPIAENEKDLPLKKHMSVILNSIEESLDSAVFLYDGELRHEDDTFDNTVIKKKRTSRIKTQIQEQAEEKSVQVTIFIPSDHKEVTNSLEIKTTAGQIKLTGQIACRVWLHPKAPVSMAAYAVKEDLVRSLAARLEMHWDSLIEEEHGSPEDTNSIHEPPRRVLVALPQSNITFSDYLFPGEGPQEAQISLQELLDITVNEKDGIKDIEGQADLTGMYNDGLDVESDEILPKLPTDTNKFMYSLGLGVASFVFLLSLFLHYFQQES